MKSPLQIAIARAKKKEELRKALLDGENSSYAREYDHADYLNELVEKYNKPS